MSLVLVTPPAADPVSLADLWNILRIDAAGDPLSSPFDDELTIHLRAAVAEVDGADGWLGRAIMTQTWRLVLDYQFPSHIHVPLPPLQSVDSITYVDTDGVTQTLAADQYTVTSDEPAIIVPAYGVTWPNTQCIKGAVTVEFTAGYGDDAATVTERAQFERIQDAILFAVKARFDGDDKWQKMSSGLLDGLRVRAA